MSLQARYETESPSVSVRPAAVGHSRGADSSKAVIRPSLRQVHLTKTPCVARIGH
jgi:hypothetical protein